MYKDNQKLWISHGGRVKEFINYMTQRRKQAVIVAVTGLLTVFLIILCSNLFLSKLYAKKQYETSAFFVNWFIEEYPQAEAKVIQHLKDYKSGSKENVYIAEKNYFAEYGFDYSDFERPYKTVSVITAIFLFLSLIIIFIFFYTLIRYKNKKRISQITDYLMCVNNDKEIPIADIVEDDFSLLEDEIYKTVTHLKTTKENAVRERMHFAENLANIAHQIKTPITSVLVSFQMLKTKLTSQESIKIERQIEHINSLVSTLLTISKIDAGILKLKSEDVDVYTALELSVETLENQIRSKDINIILPNHPEIYYKGDLDWSVEVFINLIKNCIEHTKERGKISFEYEKNPLYVEIVICDNGEGFDEKDLPHIFERFYQSSKKLTGTGIGLSMAKAVIEMQNGFITAKNSEAGGACFVIRFYCH